MFEKAKQDIAIARDIPKNVQIIAAISLFTLAVCLVTLALTIGKGGK